MKSKTCSCTGHRPQGLPWGNSTDGEAYDKYFKELTFKIMELINNGYTHFISGVALDINMDFADIVIGLRDTHYENITLEIAAPCADQHKLWSEKGKERYLHILENANLVTYVSKTYTHACMQLRNEYMVDKSDLVLAFWNGEQKGGTWKTIAYCRKVKKFIEITNIIDLCCLDNSDKYVN